MFKFFSKMKQRVHFLHIGKTGGSAIKSVLNQFLETPKYSLELHSHGVSLKDIPEGDSVVLFLRDPVSRFISGFYSRQRKGQPRYYSEWNPKEKEIFGHFHTPNEIAVALATEKSGCHALALTAMKHVQHFRPYKNWYVDFDYFDSRLEDILFIGFQESLNSDFNKLKRILAIPQDMNLPADDVTAHRNPRGINKSIEESGLSALREWYSEDYRFIALCKEKISNKANAHGQQKASLLRRFTY